MGFCHCMKSLFYFVKKRIQILCLFLYIQTSLRLHTSSRSEAFSYKTPTTI